MAKQNYVINFTNGVSAPVTLPVGQYTFVSTDIAGYENAGTTMAAFEVKPDSGVINIKLTANGTLTVQVQDDVGAPITAGEIELTNPDRTKIYGAPQGITDGAATFEKMPYSTAGIPIYLAQNGSDEGHNPITKVQAASMNKQNDTENIINERKSFPVSFSVEDATYDGITSFSGSVTVNG